MGMWKVAQAEGKQGTLLSLSVEVKRTTFFRETDIRLKAVMNA